MAFLRRSLVGIFLVSLTVALLVWAGATVKQAVDTRMSEENQSRPARERVLTTRVVPFEPTTVTPVLQAFGELRSVRKLDLRAPASGTIVELNDQFVDGGAVQAGDVLFRVDPAQAMTTRDVARTNLAEAEADLRDAGRAFELAEDEVVAAEDQMRLRDRALQRQINLQDRGVGTEAAIEDAELAASSTRQALLSKRAALAQAEARRDNAVTGVERARINLADAERNLNETTVTAEFSGTLGEVTVVAGGLVSPNEKVAELIDPAALEVSFRISTAQYARLLGADGALILAPVRVSIDVGGVDISTTGRITRESAAVGEGQTGRLLFAALDEARGFRSGDFVTVTIEEPQLDRVAVLPATAVAADGTVLLVGEDDRLEPAEVRLVRRQGDDVIVRARGLAGRDVVAERSPLLGEGIKVRPLRPGGAADVPDEPQLIALDPERRARLVAFVEGNGRMPAEVKQRILSQLGEDQVPAAVVERIEGRMGG